MMFAPFLAASPAIQLHAIAAMFALVVGIVQFVGKKGERVHRILGWAWVVAMAVVAVSSFWIQQIQLIGDFSPIHVLSILVIVQLPFAVRAARQHRVSVHSKFMKGMFIYGLIVAGLFTFLPGRLNYDLLLKPFIG